MAALSHILFWISLGVIIIAGVAIILTVFPAYSRTGVTAFLFIGISVVIALLDATGDRLLSFWHITREQYVAYIIFRRLVHLAGWILLSIGLVCLTRKYVADVAQRGEDLTRR